MTNARILVVDDETEMLISCRKILEQEQYRVATAENGLQALSVLGKDRCDLVLCDLKLPDIDGLEILRRCKQVSPQSVFVMITAFGTVETAVEAMKIGAFDFLEKPFSYDRLLDVVKRSLEGKKGCAAGPAESFPSSLHPAGFGQIVGTSLCMREIYSVIEKAAPTDINVMIIGESGTGKELVAQSIHNHSPRHTMPFVPVNCGALPETIFESELFGHEKGSFTGAHTRKQGLLEYASGGTFFLDEVCVLTQAMQVKLLRMLQEKNIRRVGGDRLIEVNVRIISATNHDPDRALKNGLLREDLYYRLKVITIKLPPLRERLEDIPLLCSHFLKKILQLNPGKKIEGMAPETMFLLQNYSWPGNIRELQNVIESTVALARGEWIMPDDLPENINGRRKGISADFNSPLKEAKEKLLGSFEKEYLIGVLADNDWNISKTAKFCGVNRRTLQRLLKKYEIGLREPDKSSP